MLKIILGGCNGKMGHTIRGIIENREDIEITAGLDISSGDAAFPVFSDARECSADADVIVDFSIPAALDSLLELAVSRKLPAVLCATGYTPEQLEKINAASEKTAILRSANMSLGINTMAKLLKSVTALLYEAGFDIEVVEKHHNQKLDAPSGTALLLADAMNETLNGELGYKYDRSTKTCKRPHDEIGISSVRGGSIVGEHEVIFAGLDEVIEIRHTAYSKAIFAKGALQAAAFMKGKTSGMYSMADVID